MSTTVQLKAARRTPGGKGPARRLRQEHRIPGILYGLGAMPVPFALEEREFVRALTGKSISTLVVDLLVESDPGVKTLIREIQTDPLSGEVVHVDLNQISLTERIVIEVPIDLIGIPAGVKEGGILSHALRTLQIKCLVMEIPESIKIDVAHLKIGDSIHVRDLDLPAVEILSAPEITLASVTHARVEAEVVPTADAAAAAEPEVIGKKPEEGKEEAAPGKKKDEPGKKKEEPGKKKEEPGKKG